MLNQKLLEQFRKGEIQIENNGTPEQAKAIITAACSIDNTPTGTAPFYKLTSPLWKPYNKPVPDIPIVPVTDFFIAETPEQTPIEVSLKCGDRALFWDEHEDNAVERIFLAYNPRTNLPFYVVAPKHENDFLNGYRSFSIDPYKNAKPIPSERDKLLNEIAAKEAELCKLREQLAELNNQNK